MPAALKAALIITDSLFTLYWAVSGAAAAGLLHPPAALMYAGYGDPRVAAWNWSFFPLDLAFSVTGFAAVRASRQASPLWRPLALVSLVLTCVAGGMAVGYWALLGEFDPSWFLPNLALLLWPAYFMPALVRMLGR